MAEQYEDSGDEQAKRNTFFACCCRCAPDEGRSTDTEQGDGDDSGAGGDIYVLKKRRDGCTGMFWRPDPLHQIKLKSSTKNWPRDGALLKGQVRDIKVPNG
jgi:hypothetical protein